MLSRTLGLRSELAVRTAIGASRARLVRHVVAEALVLAIAGGAGGFLLGSWAVRAMTTLVRLQLPSWLEVRMEWPVAVFTVIVAGVAASVVAAVPAIQASRADVSDALGEGSRRVAGGRRQQLVLRGLVAVQVAIAVVLLTGATLMARTVMALINVNPGFRAERLITFRTDPPWTRYGGTESIALFYRRALERVQALPGVNAAAINQQLPFGGMPDTTRTVIVEGRSTAAAADERPFMNYQVISPNYFSVMSIPVISGRAFTSGDRLGTMPVCVISERAIGEPDALMTAMSGAIRDVDPDQSIVDIRVMDDRASDTVWQQRATGGIMISLALLALVLAAVGTYGVLAYAVAQREREIGVRVALGARPAEIVATVIRQGMWPVWYGLGAGVIIAVAGVRLLGGLLYGVNARDPMALVGAPLVLMIVALFACLLPARRAAALDPVDAIRA